MDWLTNGSKTLVTIAGMACLAWLCVEGKLSPDIAAPAILSLSGVYYKLNMVQNASPPAPPAEGK